MFDTDCMGAVTVCIPSEVRAIGLILIRLQVKAFKTCPNVHESDMKSKRFKLAWMLMDRCTQPFKIRSDSASDLTHIFWISDQVEVLFFIDNGKTIN